MRILFTLLLLVVLSGCGSITPVPDDRFYRLLPTDAKLVIPNRLKAGPVTVRPPRAESLYAERSMVFNPAERPREMQQYHYHNWLYAPSELVQAHLAAVLRKADDALVVSTVGTGSGHVISGRLLRLDRQLGSGGGKAVAEMELALTSGEGELLMNKLYLEEVPLAQDSIAAHVVATEQALTKIYIAFMQDVEKLK